TTSGVFTEYAAPCCQVIVTGGADAGREAGIVAGPDGNLWLTEPGASGALGQVAKLTTSGDFTEYGLPSRGSFPLSIVAGPDGSIWFTEPGAQANNVARMTTDGVSVDYPIPTADSVPHGIASGPDGNLWFAERSA